MARIQDLIAAIVSTGDGFEDIVRIITAAGHSAKLLQKSTLAAEANWIDSQSEYPALLAMAHQGVSYKRVNLKSVISGPLTNLSQAQVAERTQKLLRELQVREELHYPFAVIANQCALLISVIDLDMIMTIARQQQIQANRQEAADIASNPVTSERPVK